MKYYLQPPSMTWSPLNPSQMGSSLLRQFRCISWEIKPRALAKQWPEPRSAWMTPVAWGNWQKQSVASLVPLFYRKVYDFSFTERGSACKRSWGSRALTLLCFVMSKFLASEQRSTDRQTSLLFTWMANCQEQCEEFAGASWAQPLGHVAPSMDTVPKIAFSFPISLKVVLLGDFFLYISCFYYYFNVYEHFAWMYVYLHAMCMQYLQRPERASDVLEPELQRVVKLHVSARNQTHAPWKNRQCSFLIAEPSLQVHSDF